MLTLLTPISIKIQSQCPETNINYNVEAAYVHYLMTCRGHLLTQSDM